MGRDDEATRYQALKASIHFHNHRYHVLDAPLISDAEYDRLLLELQQIESRHPEWVSADSPSQRSGAAPLGKFAKVRHPAPVLSLPNAFSAADATAWFERIGRLDPRVASTRLTVEPKIDGLSVILHYRDGVLVQGATRGDGEVGEDITVNLRTLDAVPLRIPVAAPEGGGAATTPRPPAYLVVRGEAFIPIKEFELLNSQLQDAGQKTYLNPRNTAAGSLRQLDPGLTAARPLTLLVYQVLHADGGEVPASQWEVLEWLKALGFPVSDVARRFEDLTSALEYAANWTTRRDVLPYEADGMVVKIDDLRLAADLGVVGKDPRGAVAFKFPAREVTTKLLDIRVTVGRTGVLIPNAVLDPVDIGGVVVERATLHNFDYIAEKDIRVGDRVVVKRAGDVIPYVIGPLVEARSGRVRKFVPPQTCPACSQPVEHLDAEVAWYCVNAACPAQLQRNLEHFVARGNMDIVGLGGRIVEKLIEASAVADVADIFSLTKKDILDALTKRDRKTESKPPGKIAENLLAAIQTSRQQPLSRLISALGIRGVGGVLAADLARAFPDLEAISRASPDALMSIEGIGPNSAEAIVDWFTRPANKKVLRKLKKLGVWPSGGPTTETRGAAGRQLADLTFVITGTLPGFSREQATEFVETRGGKVVGSVSRATDYVVLGENAGSKLKKAQEYGIRLISEAELRSLAGEG